MPNDSPLCEFLFLHRAYGTALRLYPVLPQMNRVALVDTMLPKGGGPKSDRLIFAPAGTSFDTSWYDLHRLTSIRGEDADAFNRNAGSLASQIPGTTFHVVVGHPAAGGDESPHRSIICRCEDRKRIDED